MLQEPSVVRSLPLGESNTDQNGMATLGFPVENEACFVHAETSEHMGHAWVRFAQADIEVKLRPKLRVFGTVVNSRNEPIFGARVEHPLHRLLLGEIPLNVPYPNPPTSLEQLGFTVTDLEGRFTLPTVPAPENGRSSVLVRYRSSLAVVREIEVPPSGIVKDLRIHVGETETTRRVLILDPAGQPIVSRGLAVTRSNGLSVHDVLECISALGEILSPPGLPYRERQGTLVA
jgi:hypothetical protein